MWSLDHRTGRPGHCWCFPFWGVGGGSCGKNPWEGWRRVLLSCRAHDRPDELSECLQGPAAQGGWLDQVESGDQGQHA